jgi:hypothetical protein
MNEAAGGRKHKYFPALHGDGTSRTNRGIAGWKPFGLKEGKCAKISGEGCTNW